MLLNGPGSTLKKDWWNVTGSYCSLFPFITLINNFDENTEDVPNKLIILKENPYNHRHKILKTQNHLNKSDQ